jgi:pimeloyl-ACP methyl ester carboxylesterase
MKRLPFCSLAIASLCIALFASGCQGFWAGWRLGWHQRVLTSRFDNRFTSVQCSTFDLPADIPNPICGYVTVPKIHAQPSNDTLAVGVVLLPRTQPSLAAEPLILQAGSPGQSNIDELTPWFIPGSPAVKLREQHDILLIEPRGARYSKPFLDCPELLLVKTELLKTGMLANPQTRQTMEKPAYEACHNRLAQDGVNFDAYTTPEIAADIVSVLDSLGFQQVNLYGAAYGSQLGQVLMQSMPNRLRAVVLDSPEPAFLDSRRFVVEAGSYSLRQVFGNCAADEVCNQEYPNLEAVYFQLVNRLSDSPQSLVVDLENQAGSIRVKLDSALFNLLVQSQLQSPHFVSALPQNLAQALQDNNYAWLDQAIAHQIASPRAEAMAASVACSQRNAPVIQSPIIQNFFSPAYPQLQAAIAAENLQYCDVFNVTTLPDSIYAPVDVGISTLVMNGQYDNVTPLAFGVLVANNLPKAYIYNYPRLGHGTLSVAVSSGQICPVEMMSEFLLDPTQPPSEACIQDMMTTVESNLPPTEVAVNR